jgi:hypothetical protein
MTNTANNYTRTEAPAIGAGQATLFLHPVADEWKIIADVYNSGDDLEQPILVYLSPESHQLRGFYVTEDEYETLDMIFTEDAASTIQNIEIQSTGETGTRDASAILDQYSPLPDEPTREHTPGDDIEWEPPTLTDDDYTQDTAEIESIVNDHNFILTPLNAPYISQHAEYFFDSTSWKRVLGGHTFAAGSKATIIFHTNLESGQYDGFTKGENSTDFWSIVDTKSPITSEIRYAEPADSLVEKLETPADDKPDKTSVTDY